MQMTSMHSALPLLSTTFTCEQHPLRGQQLECLDTSLVTPQVVTLILARPALALHMSKMQRHSVDYAQLATKQHKEFLVYYVSAVQMASALPQNLLFAIN